MRLRLALIAAAWGCGPEAVEPVEPVEPAAAAPAAAAPAAVEPPAEGLVEVPGGVVEMGQVGGAHPGMAPGPGGARPGGPAPGGPIPNGGPPPIQQRPGGGAPAPGTSGPLERWQHRDGVLRQVRSVRVAAFRIDRTEVTRAAYQRFLDETGYRPPHVDEPWAEAGWSWADGRFPEGTGQHPVVLTSWYDAAEYCAWRGARLPTEAEWQRAMLGDGRGTRFPWGDDYDGSKLNHGKMEQPNFDDSDGWWTTSPVGRFPAGASAVGALDGFGNAWEWTADARFEDWRHYDARQEGDVLVGARARPPALYMAVRGGSYFFDLAANPVGERHAFLPEIRRKTSGFRCAADAG